jgi:hypothetical protein
MITRESIIQNYIDGYNAFDIDSMIKDLDADIVFENISNGEVNLSLTGSAAFKEQAEQAKHFFSERKQTILSYVHHEQETAVEIDYYAILAIGFPNGMKKGDELKMKGSSIFKFCGDKICRITDIS